MNRRQFLTGASAIAVSAAMPVQSVYPIIGIDLAAELDMYAKWVRMGNRIFWITGKDDVIHFFDILESE